MPAWKLHGRHLELYAGSIVDLRTDAIVTAANEALAGGGGVDAVVHAAAGPQLLRACQRIPADAEGRRCPAGQARLTPGFGLAPWVIHAVGPIWRPESSSRCDLALASAYDMALFLAASRDLHSVALPSLSTGVYGFPVERAARIALERCAVALARESSLSLIVFALRGEPLFDAFERCALQSFGPPEASCP